MAQNSGKPKVIGIIMTYNCADLVVGAYENVPKEHYDEIIVVDDGSTAGTANIARGLGIPRFVHEHYGYGDHVKFGLKRALEHGADIMVEIHGDGQYEHGNVGEAIALMQKNEHDFILGSRFTHGAHPMRDGMPLSRYIAISGLSLMDRLVLQAPLSEFHSGFRLYSRKLAETLPTEGTSNGYLYSYELITQARYYDLSITEVPVRCDFINDHTSMDLMKSIKYTLATRRVLFQYVLAQLGLRMRLFPRRSDGLTLIRL